MKLSGSKNIIMGGALALAVALAAVIGFAQQQQGTPGPGGQDRHCRGEGRERFRGGFGGGFFENLNLSDAQKEQMKQIAERYHQTFKAKRGEGRGERRGFDPLSGAAFDEAAVRAAAQARANEMVEMEVARAHMMYEMYNVLTPEQKTQLATERQQREQKRQEWRSRRQANPGANQ